MNFEQDHIELIERHLAGQLSLQELIEQGGFANEAAAEQAVDSYQVAIDDVVDEALSQDLKSIHEELYPETPVKSMRYSWLGMAAALVLVAVFGYLLLRPSPVSKADFGNYFEAYPYYDLSRGDLVEGFEQAMESYAKADFDEAWHLLASLPDTDDPEEFAFYKGVCAMAVGEYNQAIKYLEPVSQTAGHSYITQARWYLALAFWQVDKLGEAKTLLKAIELSDKNYSKAQKLLEQL